MKLVFIYGAPAVGKLTVAQELSKLTGYKIFHNHLATDFAMTLFSWDHSERRRLTTKFRLDMFEAAAKNNINIIFTYGAVGEKFDDFVSQMINVIEKNNGEVLFVKLTCDTNELQKRVTESSRALHNKITTHQELEDKLLELDYSQEFTHKPNLIIDDTRLSPAETARKIIEHFKI